MARQRPAASAGPGRTTSLASSARRGPTGTAGDPADVGRAGLSQPTMPPLSSMVDESASSASPSARGRRAGLRARGTPARDSDPRPVASLPSVAQWASAPAAAGISGGDGMVAAGCATERGRNPSPTQPGRRIELSSATVCRRPLVLPEHATSACSLPRATPPSSPLRPVAPRPLQAADPGGSSVIVL